MNVRDSDRGEDMAEKKKEEENEKERQTNAVLCSWEGTVTF